MIKTEDNVPEVARTRVTRTVQISTRWLGLAAFILVVAAIGLVIATQRMSKNVKDNRRTAESNTETLAVLQKQVDHVERFVDQLETPTPEEQAQNAAVSKAVSEVPEIKSILCEQFPRASACQVP